MKINYTRTVQPENVKLNIELETADIANAFGMADPDEDLFFKLFAPKWETLPPAEKLRVLARVAELSEMASKLSLTASAPVQK